MVFTEKQIEFMRQQGIKVNLTQLLSNESLDLIDDQVSHLS